jgi:hypothetical protein
MYPRNAASPERIAIGPVVQISDGAVQTTGVSVAFIAQGGASTAATNSPAYDNGVVLYTPTQAETNYASFILIAYKTGCIPAATTIVTSASATTGYAGVDWSKVTAPTTTLALTGTTIATTQKVDVETIKTQAVTAAAGVTFPTSIASPTNITAGTITTATNLTNERGKYAGGAVWVGPTANTNTVSYTDGIITNPVSTIAAAKTIADALGLRRFYTTRTGTVQIGAEAPYAGYDFGGANWSVVTTGGSRDVGTSHFVDANVGAGTFASTSGTITWESCEFTNASITVGVSNMIGCRFAGSLTLSTAGDYDFIDCASIVAGTSAPTFTVPAGTVNVSFRRWSGGITISGITSGTTVSIDVVSGGTATCRYAA